MTTKREGDNMSNDTEQSPEDENLRRDFLNLLPKDAADVFFTMRKRARKYRDITDFERGILAAKLAAELDSTEAQKGRLQMLTHEAGERVLQGIREYDKNSPALHPLDRA